MISGSRILLGVTGSIAAYKAPDIARRLRARGAEVQVAMTEGAKRFITPLTFGALTGRPVLGDVFELGLSAEQSAFARSSIEHVERAHAIDLLLIAPASANTIARLAAGLAEDALTAIALATRAPILLAPAMEPGMWDHPATRENLERLGRRGVLVVGPAEGPLASGRSGIGRMVEPEQIVEAAERCLGPRDLEGLTFLVTAGPTWEAIDPVRILSNRSTGAMGIALATAAAHRGARVELVLGPTHLAVPEHARLTVARVESALEMLEASRARASRADVFVATAAVSDFRPAAAHVSKLKRASGVAGTLALVENPDILATLGAELRATGRGVTLVGFAAETDDVEAHAREKLARKGCDLVIANRVGPAAGFGPGETQVLAVPASGPAHPFGPAPKSAVAQFVLDQVMRVRKHPEAR